LRFGAPPFAQNHRVVDPLDPDVETLGIQCFELVHDDAGGYASAILLGFHGLLFNFSAVRRAAARSVTV
jgi:hypothetical protein